ncbi:bifunctional lysylphosphatidylglycerol flippase/synthetase MprF [Corynebacterium atypicum]|uniref:bifunctional lysylphosphatidylglycerol flippase/synthetase MprF n=1 Tax=Corynebacterium atypicum TaxID=191610 RepID=UPI00068C82BF|nr:DUF2156 domain-containing protein [Corynebacterium atypicum]
MTTAEPLAPPRQRHHLRRVIDVGRAIAHAAARAPVTLASLVVMWVLQLVDPVYLAVSAPWSLSDWHVVTSGLTSLSPAGTLWASAAVVVFALPAELALGSRQFAVVGLFMQLIATPVGMMGALAVELTGLNRWGADLAHGMLLSPVAWIFGTAAFAAPRLPLPWNRRLTVATFALTLTLVLYGGTLSDVVGLTAAVFGLVLARGSGAPPAMPTRSSVHETRVIVATVLTCVAFGPVVSHSSPHAGGPLTDAGYLAWVEVTGHLAWLMVNAVIIAGLLRGRRLAWWLALASSVFTAVVVVAGIAFDAGAFETSLRSLTPIATGELSPREFADADIVFTPEFLINLVLFIAPWIATVILLVATRRAFTVTVKAQRLWQLAAVVVVADLIAALVGHAFIFWAGVSLAAYAAVVSVPELSRTRDRERARELLQTASGDHLQQMTVWEDNRYWFADNVLGQGAGARGYVAFRVARGVAVTVGEPVVAAGTADEIAQGFEDYVRRQGWTIAWYSVGEGFAQARAQAGFRRVHVADESVLATADHEFRGKRFQNIRTARNHAKKEGIEAKWVSWQEAGVAERERIVALSEQWAGQKALPEMGFTLGGVAELEDPETRILIAVDATGHVHGVTSWLPVRERGQVVGLTLDMMRRDSEGFRPVIEFLLSEALLGAHAEGLAWISLSGAPLATSTAQTGFLDRALNAAGGIIEPLYGFRSLAASKHKFHPEHHSWYLLYNDEVRLPAIGLAVCSCYLPGLKLKDAVAAMRLWAARARGAAPRRGAPA